MSHTNLCQQCASKRKTIVQRLTQYAGNFRCDACRRLTKVATCVALVTLERGKRELDRQRDDEQVVTYDDLLDSHDSIINF